MVKKKGEKLACAPREASPQKQSWLTINLHPFKLSEEQTNEEPVQGITRNIHWKLKQKKCHHTMPCVCHIASKVKMN